jgi:anaphase-promoting complex subunit 8
MTSSGFTAGEIQAMAVELRRAREELSSRNLMQSATWCSELVLGITPRPKTTTSSSSSSSTTTTTTTTTTSSTGFDFDFSRFRLSESESDLYDLALCYLRKGELLRCWAVVGAAGTGLHGKTTFLGLYARYLAGEKSKQEDAAEGSAQGPSSSSSSSSPPSSSQAVNPYLQELRDDLEAPTEDPFLLWLRGVVNRELGLAKDAVRDFLASVAAFPWHWSAWVDLAGMCTDRRELDHLALPQHWARYFFQAHAALEFQENSQALLLYQFLQTAFPGSSYLTAQVATVLYNMRDFDEAAARFEEVRRVDPYRLEGLDSYSNILYVKELRPALSELAHFASSTNKYRPETCCIIGNYFSLKGLHEKAVVYFNRALKLNPHYLSAWTLMGHEYVELKNVPAAVSAYRKAIEINPRDFRAHYGLGQTYEVLQLPYYSLHYFRVATRLRPYDSRMWCAQAGVYEVLGRVQEAISCYLRAEASNDREGTALAKLAELYRSLGDMASAGVYYAKNLARKDADGDMGQETVDALLFLAHQARNEGRLDEAETLATRLLDFSVPEVEDGKALLRELRSLAHRK